MYIHMYVYMTIGIAALPVSSHDFDLHNSTGGSKARVRVQRSMCQAMVNPSSSSGDAYAH